VAKLFEALQEHGVPNVEAWQNWTKDPPSFAQAMMQDKNAGYVFLCTQDDQNDCETLQVFAAQARELDTMKKVISEDTELFLFNTKTLELKGTYAVVGEPGDSLAGDIFGSFTAQVMVRPRELIAQSATLSKRINKGPKTTNEVAELKSFLDFGGDTFGSLGEAADAAVPGGQKGLHPPGKPSFDSAMQGKMAHAMGPRPPMAPPSAAVLQRRALKKAAAAAAEG